MLDEFSLFNMFSTPLLKNLNKIQVYYRVKEKRCKHFPKVPIKDNEIIIAHD